MDCEYMESTHAGNDVKYSLERVSPLPDSPIAGKHILYLGSSVTYGSASLGVSFADYIAARNRCTFEKEAVSGTTLVNEGEDSYVARIVNLDTKRPADLFVCQLSTNDASQEKPFGEICATKDPKDFNTGTIAGAIEYIIAYARSTWGCPIAFYTNPRYESDTYDRMVKLMYEIAKKWDVAVIDLWNDEKLGKLSPELEALYRDDPIHPTQAGYLEWWTPFIEPQIYALLRS